MRSRAGPDTSGRCERCRLRLERCLCAQVPLVECDTEFFVIRHALESIKSTNSTRLASLALPSLKIAEYGAREEAFDPDSIVSGNTWLLYPGPVPFAPEGRPDRIVVLDGSWTQARGMFMRLRALHSLPKLSIAAPSRAPTRARHAPRPEQLSTIEAIAGAVDVLHPGRGEPLRALSELFCRRVLETRGLRIAPPSEASEVP